MNKNVRLEYSEETISIKEDEILSYKDKVEELHESIHKRTGKGSDYLGWVDLPFNIPEKTITAINNAADKIRNNGDIFISIGIGGSYLGARAVIESLSDTFYNLTSKPQLFFAGHNISAKYLTDLINLVKGKKIYLNVISKSGTTTEPAIAFRILRKIISQQVDSVKDYIIATTDKEKGALRELAVKEGIATFEIPGDVGGRFSVFTPVGLLPIAVSGIDINELLAGARDMAGICQNDMLEENDAYKYAVIRNIMYNKGKNIELLVNYEPALIYIAEWWKQLFGESEGKEHKSLFPASCNFTTDLHSLGQWIQDGVRNIFETMVYVEESGIEMTIPEDKDNLDGLNYIAGKRLKFANDSAFKGTMQAHISGDVPVLKLNLPEITPYYIGQLLYFFEKTCAMSGYLLKVNPFDQPGVEAYKKNMFKLLGKPGYI